MHLLRDSVNSGPDNNAPQVEELPLLRDEGQWSTVSFSCLPSGNVARRVIRRDGTPHISHQSAYPIVRGSRDPADVFDRSWLNSERRPRYGQHRAREVRLADLFCGAGGMTLGILEAGRALGTGVRTVFAADCAPEAERTYLRNYDPDAFDERPVEKFIDGSFGALATPSEQVLLKQLGPIDILVGGPPCQGHSDLNNHTRREDPKNRLFDRMARFAELFDPTHVIIENVNGARHDRGRVVQRTAEQLTRLGYVVDVDVLDGARVGVPQTRRRIFLVASKKVRPRISDWEALHTVSSPRSFNWAVEGLRPEGHTVLDRTTEVSEVTQRRIDYLFEHDLFELPDDERPGCHRDKRHSYVSVYGRIRADRPAPTITTGFTVMGQGRFVHPNQRRTLTPREGARLQFFPSWYRFETNGGAKKEIVTLIGNAVPPKMSFVLALELLR